MQLRTTTTPEKAFVTLVKIINTSILEVQVHKLQFQVDKRN
jgi:hypothetical protein